MSVVDQLDRLVESNIKLTEAEEREYVNAPDIMKLAKGATVPTGYKRCHKCDTVKKLYLFNRNAQSKDLCTAQCKDCQKANAQKSYAHNKHKRTYKKYYQEHKEAKQEQSRKYYLEHKDEMRIKHAKYRNTPKGRKAMQKAHAKRAELLKAHTGIPYTRELVIDRDSHGGTEPICYLCGKPITGTIHLDHVIPVVMGGIDCFTNVACVHDTCNLSKSKDGREITTEQVETLERESEQYMEEHPEDFPALFSKEDLPDASDDQV